MQDFEKLGAFYLGRLYDMSQQKVEDDILLYDAKDLTTHAVCVGMTGSGKTGLCLALLEEAAIDGIPALVIDPKGDLSNLLLTFPDLKPEDFRPWIDPADATRKGVTPDELAKSTAETWKKGLGQWGQEPARIQKFRDSVDIAVYTPGSTAGLPVSILRSFAAPPAEVQQNAEARKDKISAAVSGLLALLQIDADPLQSREHILLSNILDHAWQEARNPDLPMLIREIQSPPFDKLGVMDLESAFPAKERFGLSMRLNNLVASPGFSAWLQGEPLDIQRMLYTPEGKPRVSILSISHLSDAERMFFVTVFLNEVISWMRAQPGTSSLRALLYMDEVFGFFPPTANPPSKTPMLLLLKQARAFGLGIVLATQNPVDLDYKGLANAGTWFLGRLQTERDKARVLDGLEGASAAAGSSFDRGKMDTILSGLGNRVFLMNNVHDDAPVVFQTRWVLSYLRGPLTQDQIRGLMQSRKGTSAAPAKVDTPAVGLSGAGARPVLPPGVTEVFVSGRQLLPKGATLVYKPAVVGKAQVRFAKSGTGIDAWKTLSILAPVDGSVSATLWDEGDVLADEAHEVGSEPEGDCQFAPLPSELSQAKKYTQIATFLKDSLYRTQALKLWTSAALKETSKPGESEGDFRARISHLSREERDRQVEKLRAKFAPKVATLEERKRKALQRVEKEKSQATQSSMQAAISFGTSVLGALFGRKLKSAANVGRAATSMRSAGRVLREREDIAQAEETVEAIDKQIAQLDADFKAETERLEGAAAPEALKLEEIEIKPKKVDINVMQVSLAWVPYQVDASGMAKPLT
ncbi:MAG: DUF87 domain-containing protein [Planctomycetaceae bacterium]